MAIDLKGKVVLITGASSGFGQDAARLFAQEGASVVLAARRIEKMQAQVAQLHKEGGEAMATPVDVNNRADIDNMVKSVIENYERVDILFNNAGFGRLDWLETLDSGRDVQTQINVNLTGLIEVTRAVLPIMIAQKNGHIINMSSVAGWLGAPMYTVYAATKFGVRGFTDALRREVAPHGIKVSGIYPGPAATEFGLHTGDNEAIRNFKTPSWTNMSSEYVAKKVVEVAKHPRRRLIIPWWFRPAIWADNQMPWLVDWIVNQFFTKKYRQ
ncbi:MAG: SDR family NAD(P)-dependent oxidoreductase [Chloroflexi bacterium]|nr:MAG: SDR family NAD(P)-dependent oxidoreductase [Chloroflexota bacterium]